MSTEMPSRKAASHVVRRVDDLVFASDFDSGNLANVRKVEGEKDMFVLTMAEDCQGTPFVRKGKPCVSWFHFSVSGGRKGRKITMTFDNKLKWTSFSKGYKAVSRIGSNFEWATLPVRVEMKAIEKDDCGTQESSKAIPNTPAVETCTNDELCKEKITHRVSSSSSGSFAATKASKPQLYIDYEFGKDGETVYFASSYPYALSTLCQKILRFESRLRRNPRAFANSSHGKLCYTRELLTRSRMGRRVELLTITNTSDEQDVAYEQEPHLKHLFPPDIASADFSPKNDDASQCNDVDDDCEMRTGLEDRCYAERDRIFSAAVRPPTSSEAESQIYARMSGGFGLAQGQRPTVHRKKPTVLLTSRVHPGETPSQYLLDGVLDLLLHPTDPNALLLRKHFVFKIIPVLNPDGVYLGHHRLDSRGRNLNRLYVSPSPDDAPSVYAVKEVARLAARWNTAAAEPSRVRVGNALMLQLRRLYETASPIKSITQLARMLGKSYSTKERPLRRPGPMQLRFWMTAEKLESQHFEKMMSFHHFCSYYDRFVRPQIQNERQNGVDACGLALHIDFHAHANKQGMFVFGNYHPTEELRVRNALYPWMIEQNCPLFELQSSDFKAENMFAMSEGVSRLGTSRVAVFQATGAICVYTLESHFFHTKREPLRSRISQYEPSHWRAVGLAAMTAILDFRGIDHPRRSKRIPTDLSESREIVRQIIRAKSSKVPRAKRKTKRKTKRSGKVSGFETKASPESQSIASTSA